MTSFRFLVFLHCFVLGPGGLRDSYGAPGSPAEGSGASRGPPENLPGPGQTIKTHTFLQGPIERPRPVSRTSQESDRRRPPSIRTPPRLGTTVPRGRGTVVPNRCGVQMEGVCAGLLPPPKPRGWGAAAPGRQPHKRDVSERVGSK